MTKKKYPYKNWYGRWRKLLVKVFGGKCAHCGNTDYDDLTFAHKDNGVVRGDNRGSYKRISEIVDYPERFIILCESLPQNVRQ